MQRIEGKEYESGPIFCLALAVAIFPLQGLELFLMRGNIFPIGEQAEKVDMVETSAR